MTPEEYKHLKAFSDLLEESIQQLRGATTTDVLASTAEALENRWKDVHDEFAEVLGGIRTHAWTMPYPQAAKVAKAVIAHLQATLDSVKAQLA